MSYTTRNLFKSLNSNYAHLDLILVLLHLHQKVINLPVFIDWDYFHTNRLANKSKCLIVNYFKELISDKQTMKALIPILVFSMYEIIYFVESSTA